MYKKLWGASIAAALILTTFSGCQNTDKVPQLKQENPASVVSSFSSQHPNISSSSQNSEPSSAQASTVTPELKERLDGYEEFFNEYVDFLNEYKKASDRTELVSKLADYEARCESTIKALNSIDESALSKPDAKYYADVSYRISKKLDNIAQMYPDTSGSSSTTSTWSWPSLADFIFRKPSSSSSTPHSSSKRPFTSMIIPPDTTIRSSASPDSSSSSRAGSVSTPTAISRPSMPTESSTQSSVQSSAQSSAQSSVQSSNSAVLIETPEPDTSSLMTDYTRKWGYNQLNWEQKIAYARMFESAKNNTANFDVSDLNLNANTAEVAYWAFDYDNAQFLTLGNGFSYSYTNEGKVVELGIKFGRSSGDVPSGQFQTTTASVIADAEQMGSDYERLKYIHDWIVNNTTYIENGPLYKSEADGPIVYGNALCEGYSKAFMYMAQAMGYECVCIAGISGGGPHMWNMVKLDGSWYHVDVTWDDPVSSNGPILRYDYFLVSDSTIRADHTIDNPFTVPTAPYNYQ